MAAKAGATTGDDIDQAAGRLGRKHMNGTQVMQTELISYRISHLKVALPALVIGGGTLVLAVILGFIGGFSNFLHAYLAAYLFWFGLSVGCLLLTMLHHLTGGRWGDVLRPLLESGFKSLPLLFVLFLPILIFRGQIYPWMQPEQFMDSKLKHQHEIWMNSTFFTIRFVIYFAILFTLRHLLLSKYKLRDEMAVQDPEHNSGARYRLISGPGIPIVGVTVTMCMFDWGMSAQAGWLSTIYGLASLVGQGLSTVAFMMITLLLILRHYGAGRGLTGDHGAEGLVGKQDWHDLGNLLLAFTMLWGYMSLSQFLITYSGNLPQETIFYTVRSLNGWQYVGGFLIGLHWCLPFFLLLMRDIKRDPKKLVFVAIIILLVRQLDFYYQIHPSYSAGFRNEAGEVQYQVLGALGWHTAINVLTPIGIGGLWVAYFAWNLRDRRVLPAPDKEAHHG